MSIETLVTTKLNRLRTQTKTSLRTSTESARHLYRYMRDCLGLQTAKIDTRNRLIGDCYYVTFSPKPDNTIHIHFQTIH